MRDDIRNIKSDRKALRDFGLTIGVILAVFGLIAIWRGKAVYPYFIGAGILLIASGLLAPQILKIPNKLWMTFAVVLGFFMSRIVLMVLFYGVITPIGFVTRILGKDILDQRIYKERASYWILRSKGPESRVKEKESYEKQY